MGPVYVSNEFCLKWCHFRFHLKNYFSFANFFYVECFSENMKCSFKEFTLKYVQVNLHPIFEMIPFATINVEFGAKTRLKLFFFRWFIIFELDRVQLKSFVQFVNSNVDNLNLLRENWVESIPKLSGRLPQCLPRSLSYQICMGEEK